MKFRLEGYKLKGSWALIRTRGFGSGNKPSWLLIKHKDEWAGPVNITEFAPLSVKTPDADFADILAADNPAIWRSNAPAKTGDTGKLFQRIIAQAVAMKTSHTTSPSGASETASPTIAKKATRSRKAATATKEKAKKPGRA